MASTQRVRRPADPMTRFLRTVGGSGSRSAAPEPARPESSRVTGRLERATESLEPVG